MSDATAGMTIDSMADALEEFGEVTIYRNNDPDTQRRGWAAEWNVSQLTINGERTQNFGKGVTPAAAVAELWGRVAGYSLVMKVRSHNSELMLVRWNGLWQKVVTDV
jgi:hypothetical protein